MHECDCFLLMRNSEDYYARRKALEEEEKIEKGRVQRRSVTERLRSGSTEIRRTRDAAKRYSYTAEGTISTDSRQAAQAAREYRLKRRSQTFDSTSSSPEILRNPDREERLHRTSTDPASVSDEGSLSRESSISSFDQPVSPRGSSRRLEEESSTIRTQYSSRTDDSGILTFRSGESKDEFCLESSSISHVNLNSVSAQTSETPMFTGRSEQLHVDTSKSQENQAKLTKPQQEEINDDEQVTLRHTEIKTFTPPDISRKYSKKTRAPVPPSNSSATLPLYDKPEDSDSRLSNQNRLPDISVNVELPLLESSPIKEVQIGYSNPADVSVTTGSKLRSLFSDISSEVNETINIPKTDSNPQRPPRLKKQSVTSESSQEPPTPPVLSPAPRTVPSITESFSKDNHTHCSSFSVESTSVDVKDVNKIEPLSNIGSDNPQEHTSSSQTSLYLNKEVNIPLSEQAFSFDQRFTEQITKEADFDQEEEIKERSVSQITSVFTDCNSIKSPDIVRKPEVKVAERDNCIIQSETMLRASQSPAVSAATDNPATNQVQLSLDVENSRTMCDDELAIPSDSYDNDSEGVPPPLPNSAPPPLPASSPPIIIGISPESAENVITVEYAVPAILSSKTLDNSTSSEHHESQSSSIYFNGFSDVSSNNTRPTSISKQTEESPDSRKNENIYKQSTPKYKTISDLRSDFFGIKPQRSNTDILESDLIESPTITSRELYFNDSQTDEKIIKRLGYGNSVDSDVSDSDSGVPMSGGDDTFSPGDSGRLSLSSAAIPAETLSFVSSERRNILSNESIESAFDDSLSVSSASSVKMLQPSVSGSEDTLTASVIKSSVPTQAKRSSDGTSANLHRGKNLVSPSPGQKEHVTKKEQQKHTQVLKNEVSHLIPDGISKQNVSDLEMGSAMNSQNVSKIQQVNNQLSQPAIDHDIVIDQEYVQNVGKSLKSSNPSEYGFVYSAERPTPAPEVGWSEKQAGDQKVNLYSENVLQERDTTESVDRESIANLWTTKKQWENIFTSHSTSQEEASVKQKATPKWEVKLPYKEKHSNPSSVQVYSNSDEANISVHLQEEEQPNMFKKPVVTESAIEREIRLAHEREEMLRREKEERQKLAEKQKIQSHTFMGASFATSRAESESNEPAYNELAEADRNPDHWGVKHDDHDEEVENDESDDINPNESIIEREIRLQREREAEVAKMRKLAQQQLQPHQQQLQEQQHIIHSEHYHTQHEDKEDINHNQQNTLSYEDSAAGHSNPVENRIVRELRELKEREEEIRRLRSSMNRTLVIDETDGLSSSGHNAASPNSEGLSYVESPSSQGSWQREVSSFLSPQRRDSIDSTSSHSTARSHADSIPSRRDVKVRPIADSNDDEVEQKTDYFQKQETPIEREIRLTRERENDLRKQKGLPEIDQKDDNPYSSYGSEQESSSSSSVHKPRSMVQPGNSMKKFATRRLQHELQEQKERELTLLSEGKIITTSEQHIQPLKFVDIVGVDQTDGTMKRNFVTKKSGTYHNDSDAPVEHQEITSPSGQSVRKTLSVGPGGQLFSYREFKQTAESKIERELREMKEREEELRKQRTGASVETP